MHASRFFIFYMISLSVFSCSAMERNNPLTQNSLQQQIINYIPVIRRLAQGESGARILLDGAMITINGLNTAVQGCRTIKNSDTTQAIITGAQTGAQVLATNAYSAGTKLYATAEHLFKYAYDQRPGQNQQSFDKALSIYNQQMQAILNTSDTTACKNNILENLKIIKTDISAITQLINGDNNPSGIRTTIIDYVMQKVEDNKITQKNAQEYIDIINNIAQFSKTEDGQNNFDESVTNFEINDQNKLVELEEENPNIFLTFINKYMSNDPAMQTVLERKNKQQSNAINSDALLIQQLQQIISELEQKNQETHQAISQEISQTIEKNQQLLEQYKNDILKLRSDAEQHGALIEKLTQEKQQLTDQKKQLEEANQAQASTIARKKQNLQSERALKTTLETEKAKLENTIQRLHSYIKIGSGVITISAIAFLVYYFKLYSKCLELLHQA